MQTRGEQPKQKVSNEPQISRNQYHTLRKNTDASCNDIRMSAQHNLKEQTHVHKE